MSLTWESHLLDHGEGDCEDGVVIRSVLEYCISVVISPLEIDPLGIPKPFYPLDLPVHSGYIID